MNPLINYASDSSTRDDKFIDEFEDQIDRNDDIKNQFSTFIQELEQTTQKLMDEVFNSEYTPQLEEEDLKYQNQKYANKKGNKSPKSDTKKISKGNINYTSKNSFGNPSKTFYETNRTQSLQYFDDFIRRSKKWQQVKKRNIELQRSRQLQRQERKLTHRPQILEVSKRLIQNQPLHERAFQIHNSKQKVRAFKRIEQKKKEQEQINKLTFHPETINNNKYKMKPRTLQEYLKDKNEWEKKKLQSRQYRKIQNEAKKYEQCSFAPHLISKQLQSSRTKQGQRVQERLLRSLQKVMTTTI